MLYISQRFRMYFRRSIERNIKMGCYNSTRFNAFFNLKCKFIIIYLNIKSLSTIKLTQSSLLPELPANLILQQLVFYPALLFQNRIISRCKLLSLPFYTTLFLKVRVTLK